MRHVLFSALFCLVGAACGATSSDPVPMGDTEKETRVRTLVPPALPQAPSPNDGNNVSEPQPRNTLVGKVADMTFDPQYAFFLRGIMTVGDAQPTLVIVQTDTPNLCHHMAQGTMPKNASIFAAALVQTDGNEVQPDYAYTAPGHHGLDNDPRAMAFFRKLDDRCEVTPNDTGASALYGQAILRTLTPDHISADYSFDFETDGALAGHVEADVCDAPYFFANPAQFYQPVEPDQCLDH